MLVINACGYGGNINSALFLIGLLLLNAVYKKSNRVHYICG